MKLLIAEDDQKLADTIAHYLIAENHVVDVARDGSSALDYLSRCTYDLLVLDWELPGPSGVDICLQFRQSGGRAPVLFLTGRTKMEDLSTAFESGADDYLKKPFQIQELLLRVSALLRRTGQVSLTIVRRGSLVLDSDLFRASKDGKEIRLSRLEFELLELLMRNAGRLFSQEELLETIWKDRADASDNVLRTCIKNLRLKIDNPGATSLIQNFHGLGYKFMED